MGLPVYLGHSQQRSEVVVYQRPWQFFWFFEIIFNLLWGGFPYGTDICYNIKRNFLLPQLIGVSDFEVSGK